MNWLSVLLVIALASVSLSETLPEEYTEWAGRVVGGTNALSGQFPYQVSLRSASNSHFCGGAIINNRYALSAAHCTYERTTANTRIVVGTHLLNSGGVTHATLRLVNHPGYNPNSLTNDISIVQTKTNFIYTNFVQPIALGSVFIGGGVGVIATGWGLTSNPGSISNNLQFVSLQTLANGDCRSRHVASNAARVHDHTLCSFSRLGQGTCMGDSGGPLASGSTVIGLVSWGIACALGVPDVYARVSSHRNWIITNAN